MIITPRFVFINNPRTGTTFARKAIRAAYSHAPAQVRELFLPVRRGQGHSGVDHHGTIAQIPNELRTLPIASGVRNPFTLLVSIYELGLWRPSMKIVDPLGELDQLDSSSFQYFLRLQELGTTHRWGISSQRPGFGPLSLHHLQMFATEPCKAMRLVAAGAKDSEIEALLPPVSFLQQEQIREQLGRFIADRDVSARVEAVRQLSPSHVTGRSQVWSQASFDDAQVRRILSREAFLFRTLARRGVKYTFENADFRQPLKLSVREPSAVDDSSAFHKCDGSPS